MNEERMKEALDSITRRDVPDDANLWPRIASQLNERNSLMQTLRARPVLLALVVLLLLALLSGVAYAVGHSLGYIPGIGIVDQSAPIRVLAEPVIMKRDGITVIIQNVVADADRTYIAYEVKGIPVSDPIPDGGFTICNSMPFLQLPDGDKLEVSGGGQSGGMGSEVGQTMTSEVKVYYPAIPLNVERITITFPCVLPDGTGPENWQFVLNLLPASEGYATPAIEISATFVSSNPKFATTPTPTFLVASTPEPVDPSYPATPTHVPNGSGLYLDKVIELPASYILVGNFTDAGDLPGYFLWMPDLPHIEDINGKPVAFKVRDDIQPDVNWGGVSYWAYEIAKPVKRPLKITVDQIDIDQDSTVQFKFDTGADPHPGQEWNLSLPIHLSRYDYVVDSVTMIPDGYLFKFHSGTDVPEGTSFILDIPGSSLERGSGSSTEDRGSKTVVKYSESISYLVPPPTGKLIVELTLSETVSLQGPWTLMWAPQKVTP
jgi:hypothetical protein